MRFKSAQPKRHLAQTRGSHRVSATPATISPATNRISGTPWTYDNAGNIITDGAGSRFTFDAENRLLTGGGATYDYDGDGRRVRKTRGPDQTFFLYDAAGSLAAEYTLGTPPASPCTTCYLTADHLGSTRLITDPAAAPISRLDYAPFGEELLVPTGSPRFGIAGYGAGADTGIRQKFTGKERDTETGLDYFIARYYSSGQGRFISPDEVFADQQQTDPQSWNAYAYVRNQPLRYTDSTGREIVGTGPHGEVHLESNQATRTVEDVVVGAIAFVRITAQITNGAAREASNMLLGTHLHVDKNIPVSAQEERGVAILSAGVNAAAMSVQAMQGSKDVVKEAQLRSQAENARDALATEVGKKVATVTGGYNLKTGQVAAGACGGGHCAEDVVNRTVGGADGFTRAIRPKTGREVPVCPRCEATYGRNKFPPDTKFKTDQNKR